MEQENNCCRHKHREEPELQAMLNRLNRIEGQVRGIARMIEEDAYCVDVLNQTAAVRAALASFERELLKSHIETCVVTDIKEGREETAAELAALVGRLLEG